MAGKSTTGSRFYFRALLSPPACLSVPTNLNPHTDRPSQTPLSAEGRGFRHLPALHAHFSFLLSSWEKPRNERNTEGWTGRGWAEPGYWRVLLFHKAHSAAQSKNTSPVPFSQWAAPLRWRELPGNWNIQLWKNERGKESETEREGEREMGGRQTITGKRLLLLEQYKKRKAADRGFSALSWTALGTSSNTSNN